MSNLEEFNRLEKTVLCQLLQLRRTAFNLEPRAQEGYKGREFTTLELIRCLEQGVKDSGESLDALQDLIADILSRVKPLSDEASRRFVRDLIDWRRTNHGAV